MVMNSSLYRCRVMHHRLAPVQHRFVYNIFMFCVDLDEISSLGQKFWLIGHNRKNIFEFRDADHVPFGGTSVKENVISFVRSNGVNEPIQKIMLVTHLRTFGHIFNPVSFYFCHGTNGKPICCVVEVMNTFRESKLYFIGGENGDNNVFLARTPKYFYVSPFIELDDIFEFRLANPGETLRLHIDDINKQEQKFLITSLTGNRKELTNRRLLGYLFLFPLITIKVIAAIHWQAFRLWVKRVPYHKKDSNLHQQRGMHYAKH